MPEKSKSNHSRHANRMLSKHGDGTGRHWHMGHILTENGSKNQLKQSWMEAVLLRRSNIRQIFMTALHSLWFGHQ